MEEHQNVNVLIGCDQYLCWTWSSAATCMTKYHKSSCILNCFQILLTNSFVLIRNILWFLLSFKKLI